MATTRSRRSAIARTASPSTTRIVLARAAPVARRVGAAAGRAALAERHTLVALGAAAAAGYLDRDGTLDRFSLIDGVDPKAQLGIAMWGIGRMTKSPTAQHAATGLLAIALYEFARGRT